MIRFSVIIATYNRGKLLRRTLPTILDQRFPSANYEVIVMVDGSTDDTLDYLKELQSPQLRVLHQSNSGQAVAINAAIRAANGEIAVFLDDDLICDPNLLLHFDEAHRRFPRSIVFGPVLGSDESPRTIPAMFRRRGLASFLFLRDEDVSYRFAAGSGNTSVSRQSVLDVGGMDESFVGGRDEAELGVRLWLQGLRFRYCREARVEEVYLNSESDVLHDMTVHGRNEVRLCRKYEIYRAHSVLQKLQGRRFYRNVLRLAARFDDTVDLALRTLELLASSARRWTMAVSILQYRSALAFYTSAMREAGGLAGIEALLQPPNEFQSVRPGVQGKDR